MQLLKGNSGNVLLVDKNGKILLSSKIIGDILTGLIGQWKFNGDYNDSSASGENGIPINSPVFDTGVNGGANGSVQLFQPNNSCVVLSSQSLVEIQAPMSLSAWIKIPAAHYGEVNSIFGSGGNGITSNGNPWFFTQSGLLGFQKQFITSIGSSSTVFPADTWTHVIVTYDSSGNYAFYINGALDTSGVAAVVTFTYPWNLQIGRGPYNGGDTQIFFTGNIEDFRIYNRILTAIDAMALYGYVEI